MERACWLYETAAISPMIGPPYYRGRTLMTNPKTLTAAHWGLYEIQNPMTGNVSIHHFRGDPSPSPIGLQMLETAKSASRVRRPAVRKGWLENGGPASRSNRGLEPFVEVDWQLALDLVARELGRVKQQHGNEAIFGGSYGWSSAGRFHHAQSQIHRFLNSIGGYVKHVNSYSLGVAHPLLPYLVAPIGELMMAHNDWDSLIGNTELFVTFGGVPAKNAQISQGGTAEHRVPGALANMQRAGIKFVNISPTRKDLDTGADFDWWPIRPNTDTALMLALAYVLIEEGLHDPDFLAKYCVGFEVFRAYLLGQKDALRKTPDWAAGITGIDAERIRCLAREMGSKRCMINAAWSLQRAHHGEQPYWALISLAALVGQIGTPGGGFGVGYGAENLMGSPHARISGPTLPQGTNAVDGFIPVARIVDMLEKPGQQFTYSGRVYRYPDAKLIYWAGGNPFHHHQDLTRLLNAWRLPDSVFVNEQFWTPLAKMADVVFPVTTSLEREDIFYSPKEHLIAPMKQAIARVGEARDDYDVFRGLSERLGTEAAFSEHRDARQWIEHLYAGWRDRLASDGLSLPAFDTFWQGETFELPKPSRPTVMLEAFRNDPISHPLGTPSGKIELYSATVDGFGYDDCPGGHATWLEPAEWLGSPLAKTYPLHLISDQPSTRLHSQLDHGPLSRSQKVHGREPVDIHPADADRRGIRTGDIVRLFNARGSCLASANVTANVASRVVRLSTGAWFDPQDWSGNKVLEKHGNPNALTADIAASSFSQGCAAQSCLVDVEKYVEEAPPVSAYEAPDGVRGFAA